MLGVTLRASALIYTPMLQVMNRTAGKKEDAPRGTDVSLRQAGRGGATRRFIKTFCITGRVRVDDVLGLRHGRAHCCCCQRTTCAETERDIAMVPQMMFREMHQGL